jgi:thiol-disulfide isomerase/thioredoxin
MAVRSEVEGYDAFCTLIGELETQGKPVYVYFSGSKGEDGKSWCPDCIKGMFTTCFISMWNVLGTDVPIGCMLHRFVF